jgi:hypothetical protein
VHLPRRRPGGGGRRRRADTEAHCETNGTADTEADPETDPETRQGDTETDRQAGIDEVAQCDADTARGTDREPRGVVGPQRLSAADTDTDGVADATNSR